MKKLLRTFTVLSAAAALAAAVSPLSSSAYIINNGPGSSPTLEYLGSNQICIASQTDQANLPWFSGNYFASHSVVKPIVVPKKTGNTQVYGYPGKYVALFDRYAANANNLSQVKQNADKITAKSGNSSNTAFGTLLEYQGFSDYSWFNPNTMSEWTLKRFETGYNPVNELERENWTFSQSTGKYSCDFYFYDGYIPGMKLSCSDSYTQFSDPVLMIEDGMLITKIHCEGRLPYKDSILFQNYNGSGSVSYTVLKNLKCTYNGDLNNSTVRNDYKKTLTGSYATNSKYDGIRGGTDLITKTNKSQTTAFRSNKFVGFHSEGSDLYICVGANEPGINDPRWTSGSGEDKLLGFLTCGYRESFKRNNWVMNNLDNYSRICFYSNATEYGYGTNFCNVSVSRFRTLLNMPNNS